MLLSDGIVTIYTLQNTASSGYMPKEKLVEYGSMYYGERTLGVTRFYTAMGANQQLELVIRIWYDSGIIPGMYAVIDDVQYRIDMVQHLDDEDDGLKVSDLSLERLGDNYDIE